MRRAAGAAEASGSDEVQRRGHGNAAGLTSILDRGKFVFTHVMRRSQNDQVPVRLRALISSPGLRKGGFMFCPCFLFIYFSFIFNDSCQTSYINIYRADLHQICRVGRTAAVNERPEVSFSTPQGTLP